MSDAPIYHLRLNEQGKKVLLSQPSVESNLALIRDAGTTVTFVPGSVLEHSLNGVDLASWGPADLDTIWTELASPAVVEPPYVLPTGMQPAAGAVVVETDGRVWLVSPSNGYGGYRVTFPKGRLEDGLSLQATAIKEAWEEAGLRIELTNYLGDFTRTQTFTRFYIARRVGGHPADMGWESQAVHLVPMSQAYGLLHRSTDRDVLNALITHMRAASPPVLEDHPAR
jgi:8-oxo-dGTP pyrophosphatase MutT (NUDIX family)